MVPNSQNSLLSALHTFSSGGSKQDGPLDRPFQGSIVGIIKPNNVGPSLVGASSLKSIWPNYSGPPDCLWGPL